MKQELAGRRRVALLMHAQEWPGASPGAWQQFISLLEDLCFAAAVVASPLSEQGMGAFPQVFDDLLIPFRVFDSEEPALLPPPKHPGLIRRLGHSRPSAGEHLDRREGFLENRTSQALFYLLVQRTRQELRGGRLTAVGIVARVPPVFEDNFVAIEKKFDRVVVLCLLPVRCRFHTAKARTLRACPLSYR